MQLSRSLIVRRDVRCFLSPLRSSHAILWPFFVYSLSMGSSLSLSLSLSVCLSVSHVHTHTLSWGSFKGKTFRIRCQESTLSLIPWAFICYKWQAVRQYNLGSSVSQCNLLKISDFFGTTCEQRFFKRLNERVKMRMGTRLHPLLEKLSMHRNVLSFHNP
jgi:hypothetical protein